MYDISYEYAKNQQKILKINDIYIESKINPNKEAERIIEKELSDHYTHIVFGYGVGYLSEKMLQKIINEDVNGGQLLIIDPLLDEIRDTVTGCKQYIYSMNDMNVLESVIDFYLHQTHNRVKVICTKNYDTLFASEYTKFLNILKKRMQNFSNSLYTVTSTSIQWQKNIIHNIMNLPTDGTLYDLEFETHIPVVVISGGPSLAKQLTLLKKYEKCVLTIVSGSTINSVLQANIVPDFVVSVDGRLSHYEQHYEKLKNISSSLIYSMETHFKIRKSFNKKGFAFFTHESQALEEYAKKSLRLSMMGLNMGTSCANFAFTIASLMTKGPIAFIGQDLAFTNNATHANTNKDFHELTEEEIVKNQYFYVEGYNDEEVLTSLTMNAMKESFEKQIRMVENPGRVFNCTEGGARIQGMKQTSFLNFLSSNVEEKYEFQKERLLASTQEGKSTYVPFENLSKEIIIYEEITSLIEGKLENLNKDNELLQNENLILEDLLQNNEELSIFIKTINELFLQVPIWKVKQTVDWQLHESYLSKKGDTDLEVQIHIYHKNIAMLEVYLKISKEFSEYIKEILEEGSEKNV